MNNSSNAATQSFEPRLQGTLTSEFGSSKILLSLNTNRSGLQAVIPPGGFVKSEYRFKLPPTVNGQVRMEVGNYHQVVTLNVSNYSRAAEMKSAKSQSAPPLVTVISDKIRDQMSPYEPTYLILGTYPAAEFQFSIKYKVANFTNHENPLDHLYFAYTQTSFWDLISPDPSFFDTSYKPSVFLYYTNIYSGIVHDSHALFHLDLQAGTEHESNGRGGTAERSLYTAYLQPTATFELPCHFELSLQPRARAYYWLGKNNPDIADYRGYADLLTALTWKDPNSEEQIQFATKLRLGDEGNHAGLQFDLRFNLAELRCFKWFNPTIQLQYFTGYGQTLRQYNQSSHAFRAGLCLYY